MALVLSKYERVQIVASRVEQLLAGAPRLIDDSDVDDVVTIAEREIGRRMLPIRVARRLPNGKVRVHDLREFIDTSIAHAAPGPSGMPETVVKGKPSETTGQDKMGQKSKVSEPDFQSDSPEKAKAPRGELANSSG